MRAWRWPVLVIVVVALVAALVVERSRDQERTTTESTAGLDRLMPVVPGPSANGSVWFCAAGSATGSPEGPAEQTVVLANAGGDAAHVTLTAMTDTGARATSAVELPAASRIDVPVADLVQADWASVLVEADRPEVAVEHRLASSLGSTVAACASSTSSSWYLPTATTRAGTRAILAVFNPFPDDAIVDIRFETDDGTRTPEQYRPKLIRGGHVAAIDITDVVTLRGQVSTVLTARAGRVAVDLLQSWDGTDGTPTGLTLTPAAPALRPQWVFASGSPVEDAPLQQFIAYNPGTEVAEGEVIVGTDSDATVEAFAMVVRPEAYTVVDVAGDGRMPPADGYWADAVVYEGPAVVVGRLLGRPGDGGDVTSALGSPLLATRWIVPTGSAPGASANRVAVANPGSIDAEVTVEALVGGERRSIGAPVHLDAGGRAVIEVPADLGDAGVGAALELRSTRPVVVEHELATGTGSSVSLALPVDGTLVVPIVPEVSDVVTTTPGTGLPPDLDVEVPGTTPGTAPGTTVVPAGSVPADAAETTPTTAAPTTAAPTTAAAPASP